MAQRSTRAASHADLAELSTLLAAWCDPAAMPSPTMLAAAVEHGVVRVAVERERIVGCVAVELPSAAHARVSVVAVAPALRRQGIATGLLDEVLKAVRRQQEEEPLVSAVVGVKEQSTGRFLLANGFIGTRLLVARGGSPTDRIHYQQKLRVEYVDPDSRHLVPVTAREDLAHALASQDNAITALLAVAGEPVFEITRFEHDDPAALQSDECAAGIAFSGAMLATLTFLLGFSFVPDSEYPEDVRLLLITATVVTALSLVIYASASGELARLRSNAFSKIMKWGNALSEFGGVLPFLISLPVIHARVSGNTWTTMVLAVVISGGIAGYELSEFSIAYRFRHGIGSAILMFLTAAAPVTGAALIVAGVVSWPWTVALGGTLAMRAWLYLYRRGPETVLGAHRRRWQIRR